MKKSVWKSTPQVYSWPHQILNNILICLISVMKTLYMEFHTVQGKYGIMKKNIPLLLFILWVWKGEYTPHPITDNMLTSLILVGLDGYFWLSFPRNSIKLSRACILRACLHVFPFYLRVCERNWTLCIGPLKFLNSSLYWSTETIQSLSSLDQVNQFILESGSIPDQGTRKSSSSSYNQSHRSEYIFPPYLSTFYEHLITTIVIEERLV